MTTQVNDQVLTDMGFELQSHLVKDDFNGIEGQSHWSVSISRAGYSGHITSPYSMGCAHRHYRNGKPINLPYGRRVTIATAENNKRTIPNKPTLTDVLYSLVSDAQTVSYSAGFEDWCADLGYDDDSRSAEKTYRACQDIFFQLRQLGDLDELSELFQDY